ncbi:MAG: VWA domain-containing protein [Bryobacterales bacterium]|nr:VWA domain-containing protein [Bryobacterales bacterium]
MKRAASYLLAGLLAVGFASMGQEGPNREVRDTARPRAKTGSAPEAELPKIPSKKGKRAADEGELDAGLASFRTDAQLVNVDVAVLDNKGRFIPNIPQGNFRILEDDVPQQISSFNMGEAPMTVAMVIEFSNLYQQYWSEGWYQTLMAAYGFVETLKPEDYVAVVAYDLRPEILSDFSTDRRQAYEAMQRLRIAAFSESNLYDALVDTATRMEEIEGRKAIVLISSGIDTFSKLTFDQTRKSLQGAGVPIYAIGTLQALREWMDARGWMGSIQRMDFLQADNQLRTFAKETGGQSFFPRFYGEFGNIFGAIHHALRNQYSIGYSPSNTARDGSFRKIKVQLVDPKTNKPLRIVDEKGKPVKYQIVAKQGYNAPREVE